MKMMKLVVILTFNTDETNQNYPLLPSTEQKRRTFILYCPLQNKRGELSVKYFSLA